MDRLSTDLGGPAFTDYGARLRRRWKVVVAGLLLGLALGALLLTLQHKQYTSTTSVLVNPTGSAGVTLAGGRTTTEVNLDTESQLVESAQVAGAARSLLRTDESVVALLDRVVVTVPPNSQVLAIAYTAGTAKGAQEGSHAFAQAYLTNRAAEAKSATDLTVAGLQTQLKAAQEQLRSATDRASSFVDGSPDQVLAEAQRNVIVSQINDLTSRLAPLQTAAPAPGQIITDAPLPQKPSAPLPALDLGGGAVLGLLLGLGLAMLLDSRDRRLREPRDVARHVGLPVLADVPAARPGVPSAAQSSVFDRLRNQVVGFDSVARPLQVADPSGRGASGTVALELAQSLARVHRTATLVLAHPQSVLTETVGGADRPGLVEVLRGEASLDEVRYQAPDLPGLIVVPPGRNPAELDTLLQSPHLASVLGSLRDSSPAVVVETLGTGDSAAAQAVAAHSQSVLLVVERGRTQAQAVSDSAEAATRMGAEVAGVVLVPALGRRAGASGTSGTSPGAGPAGASPAAPSSSAVPSSVGLSPGVPSSAGRSGSAPIEGAQADGTGARPASSGWLADDVTVDQPTPR